MATTETSPSILSYGLPKPNKGNSTEVPVKDDLWYPCACGSGEPAAHCLGDIYCG
jgi:hypothetical protein